MQRRRRFAHTAASGNGTGTNGTGKGTLTPPPPPQTPPNDLIPLREACKMLPGARAGKRLHVATLSRWILAGKIDGWRVGGRLHVSKAQVYLLMRPVPVAVQGGRTQAEWIREQALTEQTLREHGLL